MKQAPFLCAVLLLILTACAVPSGEGPPPAGAGGLVWEQMERTGSMPLHYAQQFSVDYYEGGYALITIQETGRCLMVPEDGETPEGLDGDIVVLHGPVKRLYLAASSAMDFFCRLDALDAVAMTSTALADWRLEEVRQALEEGRMDYVGKYGSPDYERITAQGCDLVVESTMIYHSPKTLEQLQRLGFPVLVERSSYEPHPLGRMEWIRLYGLLVGKDDQAGAWFEGELERLEGLSGQESTGTTAAFFYLTSNGYANVRKPGDYVSEMIRMAGGDYMFSQLDGEENALSTLNMQLEAFYEGAWDADVLIYNSAIDGELSTIEQLVEKNELLADFKAVQNGNVWCTGKSMFQQSTAVGDILLDFNAIFTGRAGDGEDLNILYRLK